MTSTRRQLPAKLLLSACTAGLSLLLAEGYARWDSSRHHAGKQGERARYTSFDPLLGWAKTPGATVVYRRLEYTVEVRVNSHGLRDPERGPAGDGRPRILALGDSFVEGYSVAQERTLTQVLERSLHDAGCATDVINGGTGGYSTDQEYLFYREEGVKYDPRVVLLFFFANDIPFNSRGNYFGSPKPRLALRAGRLGPVNTPLNPPRDKPEMVEAPEDQDAAPSSGPVLPGWIKGRLARGAPAAYNRLAHLGLWPPLRSGPSEMMRLYARRPEPAWNRGWRLVRQVLEELQADTNRRGSHLLVVYVPNRFEIDDQAWRLTREIYAHGDAWDRRGPAERLRRVAKKAGAAHLDLTSALRSAHGFWTPTYHPRDGHWNERGHAVAAAEVERELRARGWLPCGAQRLR